jgi:putative aldouronate transport system permease protein
MFNARLKREMPLHLMLLIPAIIVLIYSYGPMVGIIMAFQDYVPSGSGYIASLFHSKFIGFAIFKDVLNMPDTYKIIWNTFWIAFLKMVTKIIFPLIFALLLNEVASRFKKTVQTITYIPYFLSWVVLGGVLLDFFSPQDGVVNMFLTAHGMKSIYFFGNANLFPWMVVITDLWKEIGFNTIIFLAALTGIDPGLYEAAIMDGANRWRQTLHVTLPGMAPIVVLVMILGIGNIVNAGFDQIFNLYSPVVYSTGDIIDTFVFRSGLQNAQFGLATAVGLFKSVVAFVLLSLSYWMTSKFTNYRVL